ncbi:MAG: response regulator [Sulfuriferula multivorans]|uniref:Sensory/regulatory protein RpfC n=1 Tax=Sulfuriferula multivorans TaxID=1559896 RepID=A0A7C9P5F2_9PROT|nr:response regulator [Sulfuriferula multivorans]
MLMPVFLPRLVKRIRSRPDSEFQQAAIRVVIGLAFLAYFSSSLAPLDAASRDATLLVSLLFAVAAMLVATAALVDLNASPARRMVAMVMDYATCSFLLTYTGEAGSPLLVVYLWVTLGNGFRYGVRYLYAATAMAVAGFILVLVFSPYWSNHMSIGVAFLLSMIAVPLYSASLLKQLHQAIQRERNANLAKSSFLANMSHELRTPLNGVIGIADLLAETKLDKEQKEFSQIIHASAHTLLGLIDNVLDISRIESGRINSTSEDFDLHQLVNGTAAMISPQAKSKGLVLAAHIAPQTPFNLHGDARHLRQILINLIGNAIKFTEHGRVDVYIRPVGQTQPPRLRFEIVDTGIGIAEDVQAHIFESFTQADPTITRRFGGSGLGTTIAKQLVEALNGQIGLHSRVGEGTTLWFELPFSAQSLQPALMGQHLEAPLRVAILASSEQTTRIQTMIRGWGGETLAVDNTTRLAAELSTAYPMEKTLSAVVVERSALPGDPTAFLNLLRDDPNLASLPVILIESDASMSTARDAQWLLDGFASVLRTPVNTTLLFNAIHAVLSHEMPSNVVSLANHFQSQTGQASRLRILVAEDNPVNQRVICGLLEHAGHQVFLAHDGEEALAMLESGEQVYNLAIIDMHMPLLSGPEVVKSWRFMENGHLPVIMLTADARAEAQTACEEAGADTFLTKPINSRELVMVIARLANQPSPPLVSRPVAKAQQLSKLDESVLNNLTQIGGAAFVQDLVGSFEEDSGRALRDIERALTDQDYGRWHDQLHMLKGGASDVGAAQLAQLCTEAERIKPYEMTGLAGREKLDGVRLGLIDAQAALAIYLDQKLSAESV